MIIILEPIDLWREYIYWRNHGQRKIAFDYLRRESDTEYFEVLIALIAKRKYGRSLKIGDWVRLGNVAVEWTWELEGEFHGPHFPALFKRMIVESEGVRE